MGSSKDDSATDGDPPAPNSNLFSDGEKVLAYHGPRIYEAKVQKAEIRKNEWRYFVHYLGWNKNWDEWVGADRLMKHTEENILKQQALDKKQGVDKNPKSGRSVQTKPKILSEAKVDKEDVKTSGTKGKKRKAESGPEKDIISAEKLVKIQIPSTLKKQLVDDWEFITQLDKLVKLPRSPTVDELLTKYLDYRSKKEGISRHTVLWENSVKSSLAVRCAKQEEWMTDPVVEILNGLRSYFDKALPVILLYKQERQQFLDAVKDNVSPSGVYGAEHLLRLFVKLPELLAFVNIEEGALIRLQQKLLDFLKFLQKNQGTFFLSSYDGSKVSEGSSKETDD